jgi:hypothetical protein
MKVKAFIQEGDNGRFYLGFGVPAYGKHVAVFAAAGGEKWYYYRQCGGRAYLNRLEDAVRAAIVDGAYEPVNESLTVSMTLDEAKKVARLLRWLVIG